MSEEVKAHGHEVAIKIIINGREKVVHKDVLSFAEVVRLAFDSPPGENAMFTVTYRNADQRPDHGELVAGQTVKVKNGTIFNVHATNKS
jgi:hypothetical protein